LAGTNKMDSLSNSIDAFYRAFADVSEPRYVDGCPCCIENKQVEVLLSTPLRELRPEELGSYAESALLTVGDIADYLYFLPRILEISIRVDSWWPDIEVTARAIRSTDLQSWPSRRFQALLALIAAVIEEIVGSGSHDQLDGWLCAIARMGLDVSPYLRKIETDRAAVLAYFEYNAASLTTGRLLNAFWELPNDGHDEIVKWFRSDAIRRIPFEAYGYDEFSKHKAR
jgi:hypothetical protein